MTFQESCSANPRGHSARLSRAALGGLAGDVASPGKTCNLRIRSRPTAVDAVSPITVLAAQVRHVVRLVALCCARYRLGDDQRTDRRPLPPTRLGTTGQPLRRASAEPDADEPAAIEAEAGAVAVAERRNHNWELASDRQATSPGSIPPPCPTTRAAAPWGTAATTVVQMRRWVSATGGEPTAPSDQLGVAALRRWPAPLVMVVDLARHIARRQLHGVVDREVHRHCRLHRAWRCAGDNDGEGTERLANQTGRCDTSADRCDPWPRAEPFLVNECRRTSSHRMNGTLGDQRRSPTAPVGCGLRRF